MVFVDHHLELGVRETVQAYARRAQVEVSFDEAKELGLGHYQVRSDSGIRRWPVSNLPGPGVVESGDDKKDHT
jgi:hypothetical protein